MVSCEGILSAFYVVLSIWQPFGIPVICTVVTSPSHSCFQSLKVKHWDAQASFGDISTLRRRRARWNGIEYHGKRWLGFPPRDSARNGAHEGAGRAIQRRATEIAAFSTRLKGVPPSRLKSSPSSAGPTLM